MSDVNTKKAEVIIDEKLCKLCGICVSFCPVQNLLIKNQRLIEHGRCIACHVCEQRCPDFALTVKELDKNK